MKVATFVVCLNVFLQKIVETFYDLSNVRRGVYKESIR